jgi:hypothetical protein
VTHEEGATVQYMLLIYDDPTADTPDAYEKHSAVAEEMRQRGVHVAADPLRGVETAKTVRLAGSELIVTDGPFAETREHLGGFYLVDCAGEDEAIEFARKMPLAGTSCIEVRRVGYD